MEDKKKLAIGGSGAITLLGLIFGYVNGETADLTLVMNDKVTEVRTYVDLKHQSVEKRLETIENLLIKIDDRLYIIRQNQKQGE